MHERQSRTVEAFRGALSYFERHPVSPEPPLLAGKRRQLRETLARIEASEHVQTIQGVPDWGKLDLRRRELREKRMLPLRQLAKGELLFAPGAEAALRVPHARASARVTAAAAIRMADFLIPHARLLRAAGVSKDFLVQMRQEARSLALTIKDNAAHRQHRTQATATIASEIKKAQAIVAVLEGLVMLHAPGNIDEWRMMRSLKKKVGRPRKVRPRAKRLPPVS